MGKLKKIGNENKEVRKITLGLVFSWLAGLLFLLVTLGSFISGSFIPAFLYLFAALILLPPVNNFLRKKFNVELSRGLKIVAFLILIIVAGYIGSQSTIAKGTIKNADPVCWDCGIYKFEIGDKIVEIPAYDFDELYSKTKNCPHDLNKFIGLNVTIEKDIFGIKIICE